MSAMLAQPELAREQRSARLEIPAISTPRHLPR